VITVNDVPKFAKQKEKPATENDKRFRPGHVRTIEYILFTF